MLIVIDLGFVRMMEGFFLLLYFLLPCGMLLAEALSCRHHHSHIPHGVSVGPTVFVSALSTVEVLANLEGSKGGQILIFKIARGHLKSTYTLYLSSRKSGTNTFTIEPTVPSIDPCHLLIAV